MLKFDPSKLLDVGTFYRQTRVGNKKKTQLVS